MLKTRTKKSPQKTLKHNKKNTKQKVNKKQPQRQPIATFAYKLDPLPLIPTSYKNPYNMPPKRKLAEDSQIDDVDQQQMNDNGDITNITNDARSMSVKKIKRERDAKRASGDSQSDDNKQVSLEDADPAGNNNLGDKIYDPTNQRFIIQQKTNLTSEDGLDAITPLRKMSYTGQLNRKRVQLVKTLKGLNLDLENQYRRVNKLKQEQQKGEDVIKKQTYDRPYHQEIERTPCPMITMMPSPVQAGYRNKNEFTIGPGVDTENQELNIGFLCGRYADGKSLIGSPDGSLTAPAAAVHIVQRVKNFINSNEISKKYGAWDKDISSGFLRSLTVRDCPITKQILISLQVNPVALTPEHNYLTKPIPDDEHYENYSSIPKDDEKRVELRKRAKADRLARESINIQESPEYKQFANEFRDFCISEFYGGPVWRQGAPLRGEDPVSGKKFVPPYDSYDLESTEAQAMLGKPDLEKNALFIQKDVYKSCDSITEPTTNGTEFTQKYGYSLGSLIVQSHSGVANSADDPNFQQCLFGSHYIYAMLSDYYFRVSIGSFLQVNRLAATSLYNIARNWAMAPKHDFMMTADDVKEKYLKKLTAICNKFQQQLVDAKVNTSAITPVHDLGLNPQDYIVAPPTPEETASTRPSVLFDVCCGTGTIGIINAESANKVVGVDIAASAIRDAVANAELNNVQGTQFICGGAEKVIDGILEEHRRAIPTSVAILDPPREGLHIKVLRALRDSKIQRLVYISCNQKTLAEDVLRLTGPESKQYPGKAFIPIVATGADLFPHTDHAEVVMMLERRPDGQTAETIKQARRDIRYAAERAKAEAEGTEVTLAEKTETTEATTTTTATTEAKTE